MDEPRSLAGFLQKNSKFFAAFLAAVLAAVVVFFIVNGLLSAGQKKKLTDMEALNERYEKLSDDLETGGAEVDALLADLQGFAASTSRYPGAKAYSLAGTIFAKQKRWADAENAFASSAKAGAKTHLYGPSLFNAAIAAEENGDAEKALDYFTRSLAAESAVFAARAQFSIGRLNEKTGNFEAARTAYRAVVDTYFDNANAYWTKLAQSRLLILEEEAAEGAAEVEAKE